MKKIMKNSLNIKNVGENIEVYGLVKKKRE